MVQGWECGVRGFWSGSGVYGVGFHVEGVGLGLKV
jgi:hypothetical protein